MTETQEKTQAPTLEPAARVEPEIKNCGNCLNSFDLKGRMESGAVISCKDWNDRVGCNYLIENGDLFPFVLKSAVLKCWGLQY